MIQANCRARFSAEDFDFIVRTLSLKPSDAVSLERLLTDAEMRDEILDHATLAAAILDSPDRLQISPQLYFYVLCRRVLKDTAVSSRSAADYIASLLEAFARTNQMYRPDSHGQRELRYICDMLAELRNADSRSAFLLRAHIANYSLFISGIFSENVDKRARKGAPDISFYEDIGRSCYRYASDHREAARFNLQAIYRELASGFREARLALNDLAERLLHLETPPATPLLG